MSSDITYEHIKGGFPRLIIKNKKLVKKNETLYSPDIDFIKSLVNKKVDLSKDLEKKEEKLNIVGGSYKTSNFIHGISIDRFVF